MITAVDSNVLLDVFSAGPAFGDRSRSAISRCLDEGTLTACDVVWAEVAGWFATSEDLVSAMDTLGVVYEPLTRTAATAAGRAWAAYRRAGGARARVVADFLVGAHAAASADRLLTRDRGFYRRYFESLVVVDPTA